MHILFLTDNFPPEVNAPASRTYEHSREWVRAGHRVTVITCAPNFPQGRVHEGYRNRPWQRESMDGVEVVRVWSYITANEGFVRRSLDYASFMASAILASPFVRGVDIVVATSPQFFTACAGWAVSRAIGRPFVFELRDLWPESIRAVGALKNQVMLDALERLELFLYRSAAAVVSVTHSFRENLIARGIDGGKITVVTNGADLARYSPRPKDEALLAELGLTGRFTVGYVGTHGMAHALETVLDAAQRLELRCGPPKVQFLLLGDGAAKSALKARAQELDLGTVTFVDSVPKDQVTRYWSVIDASLIHLKNTDLFTTVIPSKIFESMAMGIPILHGVAGEFAEIVLRAGAGLVFEPENAEALEDVVLALAADEGLRGRMSQCGIAAARRYDRASLAADMLGVLEEVALTRRSRRR